MNIESLKRQNRKSGRLDNKKWWERQCKVSSEFNDIKAWGAFVDGVLTNYIYVIIHDDILIHGMPKRVGCIVHAMSYTKYIRSDSEYGKCYPNDALLYFVTKELLTNEQCACAIHGLKSGDSNLDLWKRHMGYTEEPVFQTIIINPILHLAKPFVPKLKLLLRKDRNL